MPKLVLAHSVGVVDLVAQDEEGSLAQVLHAEQRIELGLALSEALGVLGVDEEDDAADLGEVVLPQAAGLLVAAEIEGGEAAAADGELFGCRVQGGLEDCDAVVLEHVEELEGVVSGWMKGGMSGEGRRTVVLPALSRPRKSSLACLFASPSWASMSQTVRERIDQHVFLVARLEDLCMRLAGRRVWVVGGHQHTPVNDPHVVL
jgi:hypothetical protein